MENNSDLLERIRRSQQSSPTEPAPQTTNGNGFQESVVIEENLEQTEQSKGMFEKYAIAMSPLLVIVLLIVGLVFLASIFRGLQYADLIDLNSWHGYVSAFVQILYANYMRDCLKKWRQKKGATLLGNIALILCYLDLLIWWSAIILDGYKDIFG